MLENNGLESYNDGLQMYCPHWFELQPILGERSSIRPEVNSDSMLNQIAEKTYDWSNLDDSSKDEDTDDMLGKVIESLQSAVTKDFSTSPSLTDPATAITSPLGTAASSVASSLKRMPMLEYIGK